ncbi:MAG: NAD-glutamate dehydrogenase domain-containing protein [Microthrixaceae bacterium]
MVQPSEEHPAPDEVTRSAVALARARGRPDEELTAAVAMALLQRVAPAEVAMTDPAAVAPTLLDAVELLAGRERGAIAVRVAPLPASLFGPEGGRTAVVVAADDGPLLFSTVLATVYAAGYDVRRFTHPVLGVRRDPSGRVEAAGPPEGTARESLIHVEVAEALDGPACRDLADRVRDALDDLLRVRRDHDAMRVRVEELADRLEEVGPLRFPAADCGEAAAFCRWLLSGNFLLLGVEHEPADGHLGIGLGAGDRDAAVTEAGDPGADAAGLHGGRAGGRPVEVRRSGRTSRVARAERLAEVVVAELDDAGESTGRVRLLGLTTLEGRNERPSGTPWVRAKLRRVLAREQVAAGSHDETVLRALFDGLPWDLLLLADDEWLRDALVELARAEQTGRAAVRVLVEPDAAMCTVLVGTPPESARPELAAEVEAVLVELLGPTTVETAPGRGAAGLTMWSFAAATEGVAPGSATTKRLRERVAEQCRSWSERLTVALTGRLGPPGTSVARRWLPRLPEPYRQATPPDVAAGDVEQLERLDGTGGVSLRVRPDGEGPWHHIRVTVGGPALELSGFVPVLESLGLVVAEEMTFGIDGPPVPVAGLPGPGADGVAPTVLASVMDLRVARRPGPAVGPGTGSGPAGTLIAPEEAGRLEAAVLACWSGESGVDRLNELVLAAGLDRGQVSVLRAAVRYLSQLSPGLHPHTVAEAVADNPPVARALWDWFESRFGPTGRDAAEPAGWDEAVRDRVLAACDGVARLDHERLCRDLLSVLDAVVRTNVWARHRAPAVVLDLDGARLPRGAGGRTWRELWVSGGPVEGVHLRAGPVARGGLRWSDREGDVRTEVLQLMEAQRLKNALIVPTGAKGGFVLRHRPEDPARVAHEVRRAYSVFVNALLDVVDDLEDGTPVHPPGVRPADGPDTYLVVAADRGTATFSDLANSFARDRGFWLDDAFASGGSDGYDHKALGVTARGAWVSVTEHFAGLGIDVMRDPVRTVGVGDMSGDVFGNGMLLSPTTLLVAAFDHRHVFLDPRPDPERSRRERQRLFELPGSSWADVDPASFGPGAMVVPRSAKRVALTPEVRELLDLPPGPDGAAPEELDLPDLVRAVLRIPADLLYFGGIGTFVRGSEESDGAVGDPTNDEVRVTGRDLRVRVVAEGANLGVTPRGRVEFALAGGLINNDAVDNSAGVDSSDHEVNLKVLLAAPVRAGELDRAERNQLLAGVADDVVAAVLANVARQNRALTREAATSRAALEPFLALLFALEADGAVNRTVHGLPSGAEVRHRRERGTGLVRPELAVLLAATKQRLADLALAGPLPDREPLRSLLVDYFPPLLADRFAAAVDAHPLARQLVAARLANEVVDRMGMTWVQEAARSSGEEEADVLAAYWMARETARIGRWWAAIDDAPLADRDVLWDPARQVIDLLAGDYLRRGVARHWRWEEIERNRAAARVLARRRPDGSEGPDATRPGEDPAARADRLRQLALAPGLAQVAHRCDRAPEDAAAAYLDAGRRFGLDHLTRAVLGADLPAEDTWSQRHRQSLLFDLDRLRRAAAEMLLRGVDVAELEARLDELAPRVAEAVEASSGTLDPLAVVAAELWLVVEDEAGEIPRG